MKVTLLGTGTSQGVPVIGCQCKVCTSTDPADKRLRCSAYIEIEQKRMVIDVGPDFRYQMLRAQIESLDAILLTHEHNDHIAGMDDIRPFNFRQRRAMPFYGLPSTLQSVQERFAYIFATNPYPGSPSVKLVPVDPAISFDIQGIDVVPISALHGKMSVLGYRIRNFCYLTDIKTIDSGEMSKLQELDVLVINALHHRPHHSHLNLQEAVELANQIQAKKTYFIHISHHMGLQSEVNKDLPSSMQLGYDGLIIELR